VLTYVGGLCVAGELVSLKHFKNEVESIKNGVECGLSFSDQTVIPQPGDTVVCFDMKKQKQTINWDLDF
jgi:translation initiation factor IF-2